MFKVLYAPRFIACHFPFGNRNDNIIIGYIVDRVFLDSKTEKTIYDNNVVKSRREEYTYHFQERAIGVFEEKKPYLQKASDKYYYQSQFFEDYNECKKIIKKWNKELFERNAEESDWFNTNIPIFKELITREQEEADRLNGIDIDISIATDLF